MTPTRDTAASTVPPAIAPRPADAGGPGPFPVTIVRPTTVPITSPVVRRARRRRAAERIAERLNAAAVHGGRAGIQPGTDAQLRDFEWTDDIIARAPHLAAARPRGALRVGRNRHGAPVTVVVHDQQWSLVLDLRPDGIELQPDEHAASWTFLDPYPTYLAFCFDEDDFGRRGGAAWTAMVDAVVAAASTRRRT